MDRAREAVEHLQAAVVMQPYEAQFYRFLGEALLKTNQVSRARDAYEEAIRLNPDDAAARAALEQLRAAGF